MSFYKHLGSRHWSQGNLWSDSLCLWSSPLARSSQRVSDAHSWCICDSPSSQTPRNINKQTMPTGGCPHAWGWASVMWWLGADPAPDSRLLSAVPCAAWESLGLSEGGSCCKLQVQIQRIILGFQHAAEALAINFLCSLRSQGFSTLFISLGKSLWWLLSYFLIRLMIGITWL